MQANDLVNDSHLSETALAAGFRPASAASAVPLTELRNDYREGNLDQVPSTRSLHGD